MNNNEGIITKRDLRMYIFVNGNIKISKGKLAGQVGHAVNLITYYYSKKYEALLDEYMAGDIKKIVLKADSDFLEELEKNRIGIAVRDKGYTELEPNTLTCVGVGIYDPNEVFEIMGRKLSEFKLY